VPVPVYIKNMEIRVQIDQKESISNNLGFSIISMKILIDFGQILGAGHRRK
jgi:hypothetical protein